MPSIGGQDGGGFTSEFYTHIMPYDRATLMACCNGMGKYYVAKNDLESVSSSYLRLTLPDEEYAGSLLVRGSTNSPFSHEIRLGEAHIQ